MARAKLPKQVPTAGGPAQPQELPMEATPTQASAEATPPKPEPQIDPTTAASEVPDYPKDMYDAAGIENEHRDFNEAVMRARAPNSGKPVYVPPALHPQLAEQTRLEMEAGRKRVEEAEAREVERKGIAMRTKENWEKEPARTVPVFRPPDFSEYKNSLKSQVQTPSKDNLRAPQPRV